MNKFILIASLLALLGMTILVNPEEIKIAQLTTILVLIFFFLMSLLNIITKYIFGYGSKSTLTALVATVYVWSTLAMKSIGSGSVKDIVIFSMVFVIAFFYIKQNFITTK
ncbi:MAG: hypothetical protein AAB914_03530 [Patescibacteria group bacterium]